MPLNNSLVVILAFFCVFALWVVVAQHIAAAARRAPSPSRLLRLLETMRAYIANEEPSFGSSLRMRQPK
jgi:vancomycin permeability regulator SanA